MVQKINHGFKEEFKLELLDLIDKRCIKLEVTSKNKSDLLDEMIELLYEADKIYSKEGFKEGILNREAQSSTGLGFSLAIPHAKSKEVKTPSIAIGFSKEGIDYESLDGEPVKLVFMIAAPEDGGDLHVMLLAELAKMLIYDDFREKLLAAESVDEVINIIDAKAKEQN